MHANVFFYVCVFNLIVVFSWSTTTSADMMPSLSKTQTEHRCISFVGKTTRITKRQVVLHLILFLLFLKPHLQVTSTGHLLTLELKSDSGQVGPRVDKKGTFRSFPFRRELGSLPPGKRWMMHPRSRFFSSGPSAKINQNNFTEGKGRRISALLSLLPPHIHAGETLRRAVQGSGGGETHS